MMGEKIQLRKSDIVGEIQGLYPIGQHPEEMYKVMFGSYTGVISRGLFDVIFQKASEIYVPPEVKRETFSKENAFDEMLEKLPTRKRR